MATLHGVDLDRVANLVRIGPADLLAIATDSDRLYQSRWKWIRGKRRHLILPDAPLRTIQRHLTRRLLRDLSVHPAAYCAKRRGALAAARLHARHRFLLHLDIKDFFPSVAGPVVKEAFEGLGASPQMASLLTGLVVARGQLPQGASPSVAVSNIVMRRLDARIGGVCRKYGLAFTRYVDDIAISGGSRLTWVRDLVRSIVREEGWELNDKGGLIRPTARHLYLGLVLNSEPNVDGQFLADLRRLLWAIRKRGEAPSPELVAKIEGRIRYVGSVNPRLGRRLAAVWKTPSGAFASS